MEKTIYISQILTLTQYIVFAIKGHAADVFEAYSQLLTEMVLRLPYQIKKIADANPRIPPPVFDHSWFYYLSEVSHLINVIFFLLSFQKREIDLFIFFPPIFPSI